MICPRCEARLLARERTALTCGRCRQPFALEPKLTKGLQDLRLTRTVERLGDEGRIVVTVEQLRWAFQERGRPAALPREVPPGRPHSPSFDGVGEVVTGLTIGVVLLATAFLLAVHVPGAVIVVVVTAFIGLVVTGGMARPAFRLLRRRRIEERWKQALRAWEQLRDALWREQDEWTAPLADRTRWSVGEFQGMVVNRWNQVYGGLPAGVVEDSAVTPVVPQDPPALAVLCPDPTVTAFLHANAFPERHGALIAATPGELPEDLPVVVLHDASPQGCLLVAEVRAARPDHPVVDAGLSARAVLTAGDRAVQLYAHQRREPLEELLHGLPRLTGAERDWLAAGLWSPLAAVPPKRLLAMAERAAERALNRHVGFLSWPVPEVPR
ncbi:hypothetical protein ABTX81_00390 [Kitasatospora sp. NPDC097605]|uniref:hypothetical protein n=1 Tax=Kitasatospora sp. NPDC097605 TaxID=3157226 RepID=UPI003323A0A4